jgi:hypothetical protein
VDDNTPAKALVLPPFQFGSAPLFEIFGMGSYTPYILWIFEFTSHNIKAAYGTVVHNNAKHRARELDAGW